MPLLGQTQLGCVTLLVIVLFGLSSTGEGVKQELWLYTANGNALYFQTHVPDLTQFSATLPEITRVCMNGLWLISNAVNYQTYFNQLGNGKKETTCGPVTSMSTVKSLRHYAANDTASDAISLYSGTRYTGEEIFVDTRAKTDISISIISLAATGSADWMLYEGKNFDGKSVCYKVPRSGYEFEYGSVEALNMITIGSVFKGCDLNEIQLYSESL